MSALFEQLEDREFFKTFVAGFFSRIPHEMDAVLECEVSVDEEKLDLAFDQYAENVAYFRARVFSENPDHYKRAGALLQALCEHNVIGSISFVASLDSIETGFSPLGINHSESSKAMPFARFFEEYANEMNSFIFTYRCCATYEKKPRTYDIDYLNTMCVFLKSETNQSAENTFLIFKSLMH